MPQTNYINYWNSKNTPSDKLEQINHIDFNPNSNQRDLVALYS
jgi:hypothetical protein